MQVTWRLNPSEVNANYSALREDINSYIDDSVMAKQPEIDLWEFMKTRPDKLYEEWAYEIGSDLTTEYKAVPLTKLDINDDDFFKFMKENKDTCQKKYYERRPYHNGRSELTENFPMKCWGQFSLMILYIYALRCNCLRKCRGSHSIFLYTSMDDSLILTSSAILATFL